MQSQHFQEYPIEILYQFLQETLTPEEMKFFANHYHHCLSCRQWLNQLPLNGLLLHEAETFYQQKWPEHSDFFEVSWDAEFAQVESTQLTWTSLQARLQKPVLQFFSGGYLVWSEPLQSRAAGVSESFSSVELPEEFIAQEKVTLIFEEDPIDHSLNIGLKGSSAKTRLATCLKIAYTSGETECFEGKDIALGSMWSLPFWKAKKIQQFDLFYGTSPRISRVASESGAEK